MKSDLQYLEMTKVDDVDPMLSKTGVLSAKNTPLCAENNELPIKYYDFTRVWNVLTHSLIQFYFLQKITFYPDQKILVKKLINAKINFELIEGKNMPHIWPFLPVMKEAKIALNQIIKNINK